jgi:hypothetical protein
MELHPSAINFNPISIFNNTAANLARQRNLRELAALDHRLDRTAGDAIETEDDFLHNTNRVRLQN